MDEDHDPRADRVHPLHILMLAAYVLLIMEKNGARGDITERRRDAEAADAAGLRPA
jgi:hypothetical protein